MDTQDQQVKNNESSMKIQPTKGEFLSRQPLLALSGLGAAVGSVSTIMRKIKRISPKNLLKIPKVPRIIPKYMKSNYLKYPALLILLLASVKKLRSIMNY